MYHFNSLPYTPLRITSQYTLHRDVSKLPAGATSKHEAVDIGTNKQIAYTATDGGPVTAVMAGRIVLSSYTKSRGNRIIIDHGMKDGKHVETAYQALKAGTLLPIGTEVKAGQIIAHMGATDISRQLHLHFELMENGCFVDPTERLKNIEEEEEPMEIKDMAISFNGKPTTVKTVLVANENYVRLRDLSDADKNDLFTVAWNEKTKTVVITSK